MGFTIADYLELRLGPPQHSGDRLVFVCPFCDDTTGHFHVKLDRRIGFCVRCGFPAKGQRLGLLGIIAMLENTTIPEVKKMLDGEEFYKSDQTIEELLAEMNGEAPPKRKETDRPGPEAIPDSDPERVERSQTKRRNRAVPLRPYPLAPGALDLWEASFLDILDPPTPLGLEAQSYLFHERGVSRELIQKYHLRYGQEGLTRGPFLMGNPKGGAARRIRPMETRVHGRILIPIIFRGEIRSWQGRAFLDDLGRYENAILGTDTEWSPSQFLFGWDEAVGCQEVIVVEGPFDAMNIGRGAVAMMGKGLSPDRLKLIRATGAKSATILYDADIPKDEKLKLHESLKSVMPTKVAYPTAGKKDAGEMSPDEIRYVLKNARAMTITEALGL